MIINKEGVNEGNVARGSSNQSEPTCRLVGETRAYHGIRLVMHDLAGSEAKAKAKVNGTGVFDDFLAISIYEILPSFSFQLTIH